MPSRPATLNAIPSTIIRAGVPSVGERGECDLGDERRQEAHRHDQTERTLADAVLIAELVEHGEHHAVPRGEQRRQRAEDDDDRPSAHPIHSTGSLAQRPPIGRCDC